MTFFGIPRGPGGASGGASLVSFGSSNQTPAAGDRLYFSGASAVSATPSNSAPKVLVAGVDAFDYITGQAFAVDKTGMGGMPFKESVVTWTYYVAATAGLSESATWIDLETRLGSMYLWYWSTYSYTNPDASLTYTGASGQKGDLLVKDASGNVRYARAQWVSFPDQVPAGQVSFYEVELTFHLLSHFQALPYP
jgi:hypothetical protein